MAATVLQWVMIMRPETTGKRFKQWRVETHNLETDSFVIQLFI